MVWQSERVKLDVVVIGEEEAAAGGGGAGGGGGDGGGGKYGGGALALLDSLAGELPGSTRCLGGA